MEITREQINSLFGNELYDFFIESRYCVVEEAHYAIYDNSITMDIEDLLRQRISDYVQEYFNYNWLPIEGLIEFLSDHFLVECDVNIDFYDFYGQLIKRPYTNYQFRL